MAVTDAYLEHIRDRLAWVPGLRARRMFGGVGLSSEGASFALLADDTLYLKADDANRDRYRAGGAEILTYQRQGKARTMGYWSVPADVLEDDDRLRDWTRAALAAAMR